MMRNKLQIHTVGNGFVIDFGNKTAMPSVDEFTRVARTPDELADIVRQWATTEVVIPADSVGILSGVGHNLQQVAKVRDAPFGEFGSDDEPSVGEPVKFRRVPKIRHPFQLPPEGEQEL